jgi:hypothetical protein
MYFLVSSLAHGGHGQFRFGRRRSFLVDPCGREVVAALVLEFDDLGVKALTGPM